MGHQNDLLSGQRRRKTPVRQGWSLAAFFRNLLRFVCPGIPVFFVFLAFYLIKENISLVTAHLNPGEPVISFRLLPGNLPPDPTSEEALLKLADQHLKKGGTGHYQDLAESILSDSPYAQVIIHQNNPQTISIFLKKPSPVFLIPADRLRLISSEGLVYGVPEDLELPELTGIFSDRTGGFELDYQNFIRLSESEKERIRSAILLKQNLLSANFNLHKMIFRKYRGYFATLSPSDTVVSFGKAPFEVKIKKLRKIVQDLSSRGRYAERIELDYTGKAFVKEKLF